MENYGDVALAEQHTIAREILQTFTQLFSLLSTQSRVLPVVSHLIQETHGYLLHSSRLLETMENVGDHENASLLRNSHTPMCEAAASIAVECSRIDSLAGVLRNPLIHLWVS